MTVALCVFLVIYPFIMGFHVEEPVGIAETYFTKKSGYMSDTFQYYKEVVLIVFSAVLLILLGLGAALSFVMEEKWPKRYTMDRLPAVLLAVFLILHILSCVFSEFPEYAFLGLCLDYEGMAAIAGYGVLFTAGYMLLGTENGAGKALVSIRALALLIISGACFECIFGPAFNLKPVAEALTPDRYEHLLENVFLDYNGSISLTFANPGYFGGFCALLFPVLYGTAVSGRKKMLCVFDSMLAGGLFFCVIMSGSSGALYAAVTAAAGETIFLLYRERKYGNYWGIPVVVAAAAGLFLILGNTQIMDGEGGTERMARSVVNSQYTQEDDVFRVDRISLEGGILTIESDDRSLKAEAVGDGEEMSLSDIRFTDGNGSEIPLEQYPESARLSGEYSNVSVTVLGRTLSLDLGYQDPVEFYCYDGALYYIDFNGSLQESIPQPQVRGLEFLYPLFTGRGYIWVSSIPVLKECIFLGKGVGTFPFVYPQSEVAGMLNVHGSADYCIEIAHSWYLQTAVNGGIPALLCLLLLFALHLAGGVRAYWKRPAAGNCPEPVSGMGMALFFGVLAYQIVGIVNNSSVAASPGFWILFGCSMGILRRGFCHNRSNDSQKEKF